MKDRENRNFWQKTAKIYGYFMKSAAPTYEKVSVLSGKYINKKMKVLELACGSGQFSFGLSGKSGEWHATDFSDKMIFEAKKQFGRKNLFFKTEDATALSYKTKTFDGVFIANALHIMPDSDKALLEIHRVLNSKGLLLAPTFIWGEDLRTDISAWIMELFGFHVFHKWREAEYAAYIESMGFIILERIKIGGSIRPLCFIAAKKTARKKNK